MTFWKYQLQYAYFRPTTCVDHTHIYLLLLSLNIPCIKYSVYAVIFFRLMQSMSLESLPSAIHAKFQFKTIWDHGHFYFYNY